MNKRAAQILNESLSTVITSSDPEQTKVALFKLAELADALDSMGLEKDADQVDQIMKEAGGMMGGFLGALLGTGGSFLDVLKSGNYKQELASTLTKFLLSFGVSALSVQLVELIFSKVPFLKFLVPSETIKTMVTSVLSYAISKSSFSEMLTEGILQQVDKLFNTHLAKFQAEENDQAAAENELAEDVGDAQLE